MAETRPRPKIAMPPPTAYTEEALWEHSVRARAAEVEPPEVTHYPVGTWCSEGDIRAMHQMREYRLDDPDLVFLEGAKHDAISAKYAGWIAAGSEPPPGRAIEMEDGRVSVTDGHHRASALRAAGRDRVRMWVSPVTIRPNEFDPNILAPCGLTHHEAVREALAAGHDVPVEVLADYPDLAQRAASAVQAGRPRFAAALGPVTEDGLDMSEPELIPADRGADVRVEL